VAGRIRLVNTAAFQMARPTSTSKKPWVPEWPIASEERIGRFPLSPLSPSSRPWLVLSIPRLKLASSLLRCCAICGEMII
jgi:hypothetical protein